MITDEKFAYFMQRLKNGIYAELSGVLLSDEQIEQIRIVLYPFTKEKQRYFNEKILVRRVKNG